MATKIVKPNEDLKLDSKQFQELLTILKNQADTIVVKDADTCLLAKTRQRDIRSYMKDVHLKLDPFVEAAKRNLQTAKDEINRWLVPAEAIDETLAAKVKEYERVERERTLAEQRREQEQLRIATERRAEEDRKAAAAEADRLRKIREKEIEEQRKAGELTKREAEKAKKLEAEIVARAKEQAAKEAEEAAKNVPQITVKPNIPAVAGVPSRRNWKFRIIDTNKIPRKYLMPDTVKIGQDVRDWKKPGEVIPGVEAYED